MNVDRDANAAMWAALPDWPAWEVTAVEVVGPLRVRVTHRDGTAAVHGYTPEHFTNALAPLRHPAVFATAAVLDGTLGWVVGGQVFDLAPDALYLHAIGRCDGSCGRPH